MHFIDIQTPAIRDAYYKAAADYIKARFKEGRRGREWLYFGLQGRWILLNYDRLCPDFDFRNEKPLTWKDDWREDVPDGGDQSSLQQDEHICAFE